LFSSINEIFDVCLDKSEDGVKVICTMAAFPGTDCYDIGVTYSHVW